MISHNFYVPNNTSVILTYIKANVTRDKKKQHDAVAISYYYSEEAPWQEISDARYPF